MSKGTFKTLCYINTALGGSNEGCVGNKDVLDRIAGALGASSAAKTNYIAEAIELVADNIDDESPESIATLQVELAKARNLASSLIARDITSVDLSDTTIIGPYAFAGCTSLASVNLPATTTIGDTAFFRCSALTNVSLPAAVSIGFNAFAWCSSLENVILPEATFIASAAFSGCSSLANVTLQKVETIGSMAFAYCTNLTNFVLDVPSVPVLSDAVFMNANSSIAFYVRESMISAFQSASNWSAYASQFSAIPVNE